MAQEVQLVIRRWRKTRELSWRGREELVSLSGPLVLPLGAAAPGAREAHPFAPSFFGVF